MAAIVSSLTATAVLLHALLGCCWHHTHACTRACPATLWADHDHAHGQTAAGQYTHQPGHPGHEQPHPGKCNGHRCALAPSPPSKTPLAGRPSLRGPSAIATLPPADRSLHRGLWSGAEDGCSRYASIRSHLLYRVLLL